ncbi:hypothetical protein GGX14DRAFT_570914 [Mycena pura]|uniref:Uncharacterized protein n=1 Tax=Mycena pura TaxID=153505 RepID=A0AAD6V3U0_9AGAR|nr:hypothetical protein GGX14DRAFT_570914 [Mycena pura]
MQRNMARPPKYITDDEKVTANILKCKRGKAANRKHKRKAAKAPKDNPKDDPFPARLCEDLTELAAIPLPTHEFNFKDAAEGVVDEGFLAECRMGVWAQRPPFPDNGDARDSGHSVDVVQDWLLGFWYRDLGKEDARRKSDFQKNPEVAQKDLREEIQVLLSKYEALKCIEYAPGTPQHSMLQFWKRLDALQIHHLFTTNFVV